MTIHSRHVTLDGSGAGGMEAPTSTYAGCIDEGSALIIVNHGHNLGTGQIKNQDRIAVQGSIHITGGSPGQDVVLFFDF